MTNLKVPFIGLLQRILPHHFLSRLMYFIMRIEKPWFKNTVIRHFMGLYGINLQTAVKTKPEDFIHFNAFFTRALTAQARPLAEDEKAVLSPADGMVSQCGRIKNGKIFQAKGSDFDLHTLLGDERQRSRFFEDGYFATIYLSPKDYHRVHIPLAGTLTQMSHIPGRLFSVNDLSTQAIPGLFARNERVVSVFQTECGPMAVIMVGAIFVSSMETVWHGQINPPSGRWITERRYPEGTIKLDRGAELGRFNMGSTAIVLFPKGTITWDETMRPGYIVRMGQAIARVESGLKAPSN